MPKRSRHTRTWSALGLLFSLASSAASSSVDFIYVNAGEDSAGGGHTAIRFDDEVFHFQHIANGLIRLSRVPFAAFRHQYNVRENRTIRTLPLALPDDAAEQLRASFDHEWWVQEEHFAHLQGLNRDIALIEALAAPSNADADTSKVTVDVRGLGYFVNEAWQVHEALSVRPRTGRASSAVELRARIQSTLGASFFDSTNRQFTERLRRLTIPAVRMAEPGPLRTFNPARIAYSKQVSDLLAQRAALRIVQDAVPVLPNALRIIHDRRLTTGELDRFYDYRQQLLEQSLNLLQSHRPDWGYPLLVALARLQALDQSLATRRLVVVDRFSARTGVDEASSRFDALASQDWMKRAGQTLAKAQLQFVEASAANERLYLQIEESANALSEWRQALKHRRDGRMHLEDTAPSRAAAVALLPEQLAFKQIVTALPMLRTARTATEAALQAQFRYDLVNRNCVTEIFRVLDQTQSVRHHGDLARRVPFLAFDTLAERFSGQATHLFPSYRSIQMDSMSSAEPDWYLTLRESNVLSSNIYQWHSGDPAFLFFTDDSVWLRPLFGGINLAVAAGQSALGLLILPFDRGDAVLQSIKGAALSVPELFFVNIRKGTFPNLAQEP